jgi:glutathione S-transferase
MKILGDIVSPYVRVCLVTGYEVGLGDRLDLVETDVRIATANEDLAKLSPIAQIPVLVTDDGQVLHDSRVIVDYICQASGNGALMPGEGQARFRVLTLQAIGQGIADASVSYRNEIAQRPKALHWPAWLDRLQLRVETALDALERNWADELAETTVGSITVAVVLSYLDYRFGHWAWRDQRPALSAFHARFAKRPSMEKTALPTP